MTATRTIVTIDATEFAEHFEALAVWAEARSAESKANGTSPDWYDGLAWGYRMVLTTVQSMNDHGSIDQQLFVVEDKGVTA